MLVATGAGCLMGVVRAKKAMPPTDDISTALQTIEEEMRKMLSGEAEPYSCGWEIWGTAFKNADKSMEVMWPLWLIWGALTDWAENGPQEKTKAEAEMLRAAREWLSLDRTDPAARKAYLDRWVYDEMGYERKPEQGS
jgi:hypothetical protein